jgi:YVTN family beta-propeller protein
MNRRYAKAPRLRIVAATLLALAASLFAAAQTLVTTVTVGNDPVAVAVNTATNKIYVVNQNSNNMTIIDGATNNPSSIMTGSAPDAVAVNSVTNMIYVANGSSNSVTVVNGATYNTTTAAVGSYPDAIAVNPATNKIYVANYYGNSVTVIDGVTNRPTNSVSVGTHPFALEVNSLTNMIYVADEGSNDVAVINGQTNSVITLPVGIADPEALAIDPITDFIYVASANYNSNTIAVINGATNSVTNVTVGNRPAAVAVDPVSSQVYVANDGDGTVSVIDEASLSILATVPVGSSPISIDIDVVTNKAYIANAVWDGTVTMIDGNTFSTVTVSIGTATWPYAIVMNPQTNSAYVANMVGNSVSVIAGASSDPLQFFPLTPCRVVDTRQGYGGLGGPYLPANSSRSFALPQSPNCNVPANAIAYSVNVTVVPMQRTLNYLTAWPTGEAQPLISTLNSSDGRVKANAAIIPAGSGGAISVYVTDPTEVIVDIDGYFQTPDPSLPTLQFYPVLPCRIADTRNSHYPEGLGPPSLSAGVERDFPVLNASSCFPPGAAPAAYSFNITAVPHGPLGYLTVWPTGDDQPVVSTLNAPTGAVTANAAIVPAGSAGEISMFAYNDTDVVIDVSGYFATPGTGGLSLYPSFPCRVIDTRSSGGAFSGQRNPPINVAASACNIPSTAQEYVFNATAVPVGSLGYLTLWSDGDEQPYVSTLNANDGKVTSNMAIEGNNTAGNHSGKIDAYAYGTTNLILDISSYFAP